MSINRKAAIGILLGASALVMPQMAHAGTSREAQLLTRLERLEAEMAQLRADLASAKSAQADTAAAADAANAQVQQTAARVATLEAKPAPAAAPAAPAADGFKAGTTTIKLGGYIKLLAANSRYSEGEVATNSLGRDFYLPQAIPTGVGPASRVQDFTAKQSRFWLNFATDISGHTVKGYLETDFQTSPGTQGSQRTTNGYNLALRRAYMTFDKWTFGQDWTTFQYTGALPESTDYVGGAEGTVFVRQPQIRYSTPLSKQVTLHVSAENPESGTLTAGSTTLNENGDDRIPDFAARLVWADKPGELSFAALGRQVRTETAGVAATRTGWGVSMGGKLFLNADKSGDARFMVTYGQNIGRYVGLNFAPDGVYVPGTGKLEDVKVLAAIGALRIPLRPGVRANVMASYQTVDYSDNLALASISSFNKSAWSAAANLFWSPVKNIDLGVEYRHGQRKLVSGASGAIDRVEFAAKYSF
jgi:hypothetical protein